MPFDSLPGPLQRFIHQETFHNTQETLHNTQETFHSTEDTFHNTLRIVPPVLFRLAAEGRR